MMDMAYRVLRCRTGESAPSVAHASAVTILSRARGVRVAARSPRPAERRGQKKGVGVHGCGCGVGNCGGVPRTVVALRRAKAGGQATRSPDFSYGMVMTQAASRMRRRQDGAAERPAECAQTLPAIGMIRFG